MKKIILITLFSALVSKTLFWQTFEVPKNYKLVAVEDYEPYGQDVIDGANWLINTPVNQEQAETNRIKCFFNKMVDR